MAPSVGWALLDVLCGGQHDCYHMIAVSNFDSTAIMQYIFMKEMH